MTDDDTGTVIGAEDDHRGQRGPVLTLTATPSVNEGQPHGSDASGTFTDPSSRTAHVVIDRLGQPAGRRPDRTETDQRGRRGASSLHHTRGGSAATTLSHDPAPPSMAGTTSSQAHRGQPPPSVVNTVNSGGAPIRRPVVQRLTRWIPCGQGAVTLDVHQEGSARSSGSPRLASRPQTSTH